MDFGIRGRKRDSMSGVEKRKGLGFRVLNRYIERERLWVMVLEGERGIGCLGFKK